MKHTTASTKTSNVTNDGASTRKFYLHAEAFWGFIFFTTGIFTWGIYGGDTRFAKEQFFILASLVAAGLYSGDKRLPFSWPLFCLQALSFLTLSPYSIPSWTQTLCAFSAIHLVSQGRGFHRWDITKKWIQISLLLQISWIFLNHFGTDPWYWIGWGAPSGRPIGQYEIIGMLQHPTISAALLAACLPFAAPAVLPLGLFALFLTKSSMAIGAAGIWLMFKVFRKWGFLVLAMGVPCLWFLPEEWKFSGGRIPVWTSFWNLPITSAEMIFGRGLGWVYSDFPALGGTHAGETFRHLHMELLEILAAWGLIGVLIWAILLSNIRDFKSPWFWSFFILWVNSFGNLTFHIVPTSILMLLCYAKIVNPHQREVL